MEAKIRRESLQSVLDQCQRALELLSSADGAVDAVETGHEGDSASISSSQRGNLETSELCDLLKSRVDSPNFLEKLGSIHMSVPSEEDSSWSMINESDIGFGQDFIGDSKSVLDGYVLVTEGEIVDSIACFMASYLLSLKQTKELAPNQLQQALSKALSLKKKQGKLQKVWDGTKIIYNAASWSATAVGMCQNPALFKAASVAFRASCTVVSKLW